jgi:hypothetical protein
VGVCGISLPGPLKGALFLPSVSLSLSPSVSLGERERRGREKEGKGLTPREKYNERW